MVLARIRACEFGFSINGKEPTDFSYFARSVFQYNRRRIHRYNCSLHQYIYHLVHMVCLHIRQYLRRKHHCIRLCREEHLSCIINRTKYYSLRRSRRALAVENSSTKPISCDTCRGLKGTFITKILISRAAGKVSSAAS